MSRTLTREWLAIARSAKHQLKARSAKFEGGKNAFRESVSIPNGHPAIESRGDESGLACSMLTEAWPKK
jgi:hypothetical protein